MSDVRAPMAVTAIEADLLRLVEILLGRRTPDRLPEILAQTRRRPPAWTRNFLTLFEQRLRRGVVQTLARAGWATEPFLDEDRPRIGRLWERHSLAVRQLTFSARSLEWLIWLLCDRPQGVGLALPERITPGDRLFALLAWPRIHRLPESQPLRAQQPWQSDGLFALSVPVGNATPDAVSFSAWRSKETVWMLEAWQRPLSRIWNMAAQTPTAPWPPEQVDSLAGTLRAHLDAVDAIGRRDLARWMLPLMPSIQRLAASQPGSAEHFPQAGILLGAAQRLDAWISEARRTGYLDEGYAAAQLWLQLVERARTD